MRVLLAPEAFAGTLTAAQAAAAMAQGWAQQAPDDALVTRPMSAGGPGLVDTLSATLGGELLPVTVPGPLGADVPATLLLADSPDGARTAWVEADQASGHHLVADPATAVLTASSAGVGHLLACALATGAGRVVVGVGPAAGCDGGAGLLAALGAGDEAALAHGGLALADLDDGALADLAAVRRRFEEVELVAATTDDLPLLGFSGAAASLVTSRAADPATAQLLENALGHYAHVAEQALAGASRPAPAPQPGTEQPGAARSRRAAASDGSGAGGGTGFALTLLGARREPGPQAVADAIGLTELVKAADLVVTGEGRLGWRSLRGSVLVVLARAALAAGVPCITVAGQVDVGRRELLGLGVEAAYALAGSREQAAAAVADPAGGVAARAVRVARMWSRRPRA